ncbi:MAG: flagellar basal body-associated FliL family protein [Bacteroidota bacterium]
MAKDSTPTAPAVPAMEGTPKSSFDIKKILMIGVPIVIVQVVIIYFLFVKFIAPGLSQNANGQGSHEEEAGEPVQSQVLVIKDIIVNPAGTNGTRFLLTTVGIEVPSAEIKAELEQKEVQTRDILNSILTSKGLEELTLPQFKETLKSEMQEKLNSTLSKGKIKNIYFSKFIIQ